ncbi:arsenic resistance N-acetyltransferase ArsN2 [Halopelagius longus]|uniref:Amino-acid N-acetyltransferase n=1 Tax=Halopelagius longus TaxID=1236180 RepID=A0A1H0XPQ0_9EURY|nr:arsenic resistance N-acetyltransferase ArsN2 [Halopelagius longus]RDI71997.1 GNAT family N-acetyltransferase [Halopelagius longus]SDQ04813.1 amino-acid N-acetyltransferase [Halopelagius longus]
MDEPTVTLRGAADSLSYVETVLEANGLPARDVRSKPDCFYVGDDGGEAVGVGGVEAYGSYGLLRSVAVEESARGEGYGTALCDALEAEARESGVETLYLLTTTAAEFFADRGYEETNRSDTPEAIRETTEFEELCPASAVCMKKSL